MAHFRGTIEGGRGEVSRLGTKKSGLIATVNGWDIGARVEIGHNLETGEDVVEIYKTAGSNDSGPCELVTTWSLPA